MFLKLCTAQLHNLVENQKVIFSEKLLWTFAAATGQEYEMGLFFHQ